MPRIGWPGVDRTVERTAGGLRRVFAPQFCRQSHCGAAPGGPRRVPTTRCQFHSQDLSHSGLRPQNHGNSMVLRGLTYRELRALYDHRPTERRACITQSGTVPQDDSRCCIPRTRQNFQHTPTYPATPSTRASCISSGLASTPGTSGSRASLCATRGPPGQATTTAARLARLNNNDADITASSEHKFLLVYRAARKTKADALSHPPGWSASLRAWMSRSFTSNLRLQCARLASSRGPGAHQTLAAHHCRRG